MSKRIALLVVLCLSVLGITSSAFAAVENSPARRPAAVPSQLYTGPVTVFNAPTGLTQTFTTTARFNGDASYLDIFSSVGTGITGNVSSTLWFSSNAADWVQKDVVYATAATLGFTHTPAYGAYYRLVIVTSGWYITPTIRIVQKP